MTLIDEITVTEREAIELLMEYGYSDGSEFETSIWKARDCLKENHDTQKAVLRKLNCVFEQVSYDGKGKKRKYYLHGLRKEMLEDLGGNIGRRPTDNDFLMDEYIFNALVDMKNKTANTYGKWARELEILDKYNFYANNILEMLLELHKETPVNFNTSEIRDEFINTITKRNSDIIEKAFQRLRKAKRVEVKTYYNFKKIDGSYKLVSQNEYEKVSNEFTSFLAKEDIDYFRFNKIRNKKRPSERETEILESAKTELAHFDIEFYFKSFDVEILDKTIRQDVSKDEFEKAYFDRLIDLTEHRQQGYSKKTREYFWQKYYNLNTLAILRHIGIKELDKDIEEELNKRPARFGHTVDLSKIF